MRIYGYPPVVDARSRVLIVGSMPSVESLKNGFYYAHPRNAFWRIMAELFQEALPATIEEKKALLLNHRAALWDVYASCEREGSLDANIRAGEINGFDSLFRSYPGIERIFANGGEAYRMFPKGQAGGREIVRLPSTSPAYTMSYESKFRAWKEAIGRAIEVPNEHD